MTAQLTILFTAIHLIADALIALTIRRIQKSLSQPEKINMEVWFIQFKVIGNVLIMYLSSLYDEIWYPFIIANILKILIFKIKDSLENERKIDAMKIEPKTEPKTEPEKNTTYDVAVDSEEKFENLLRYALGNDEVRKHFTTILHQHRFAKILDPLG